MLLKPSLGSLMRVLKNVSESSLRDEPLNAAFWPSSALCRTNLTLGEGGGGERHSTEVAFAHLTQQPRVRLSQEFGRIPKNFSDELFILDVAEIN